MDLPHIVEDGKTINEGILFAFPPIWVGSLMPKWKLRAKSGSYSHYVFRPTLQYR